MAKDKTKTPADLSGLEDEPRVLPATEPLLETDAATAADHPEQLEAEEEAIVEHRTDDDSMREVAAEHNATAGPEDQVDFQERVKVDMPENPEDHAQSVDQEHLSNKHGYGSTPDADHGAHANKRSHEPAYLEDLNPAPAREPGMDVRTDEMARDPGQKPDPDARPAENPGATILSASEQRGLPRLPTEAHFDFEANERERHTPLGGRRAVPADSKKRRFTVMAVLANGVSVDLGTGLTEAKAKSLSDKAFEEGVSQEHPDGGFTWFPARDVVQVLSVPIAEEVE